MTWTPEGSNTALPLFTVLDVKFNDFSMTFQGLFKQIQDLLYQLKPECFTHFLQNKLYYSAFMNWLILKMKNNQ